MIPGWSRVDDEWRLHDADGVQRAHVVPHMGSWLWELLTPSGASAETGERGYRREGDAIAACDEAIRRREG